jgi:hypothetical protein
VSAIPPSNYGISGGTSTDFEGFNDTELICSLADSTLVAFSYSHSQSELEKIEIQSKKIGEYVQKSKSMVSKYARVFLAPVDYQYQSKKERNVCRFAATTNDGHILILTSK